jgi:colicin import membrane protein
LKASLTTSLALHAAVLAFGLVSLSAPAAFEVSEVESLPVDIVPLEELTQIQQGDKKAPMNEKPAPTPTQRPDIVADAREVGENSVDTDKPITPDPRPTPVDNAAAPPPAPTPVEKPAPQETPKEEPKPEPVKPPEPKPAPKPEPVKEPQPVQKPAEQKPAEAKPEPAKPDAVAEAIAAEDKPAEQSSLPDRAPAPQARPKPAETQTAKAADSKPAQKVPASSNAQQKSDEKDFNADEIAALLDKRKPSGGGAKRSTEQASLGGRKTTGGNRLSQNEMDALRQKLGGCWSIPAGVDDAAMLKVSVRFRLDRSGVLEGRPEVISGGASSGPGRTAAESAVRAVQKCAPFNLPADKYDSWSEVVVNFDPSDMF